MSIDPHRSGAETVAPDQPQGTGGKEVRRRASPARDRARGPSSWRATTVLAVVLLAVVLRGPR